MHLWNTTFEPKNGSPYVPNVQITGVYASYGQVESSLLTSHERIQAHGYVCHIQSLLHTLTKYHHRRSFSTAMKGFYQNALMDMLHQLIHSCLRVTFCVSDKKAQFQLFRKCDFEASDVSVQMELANAICHYASLCIGIERKEDRDICAWSNIDANWQSFQQATQLRNKMYVHHKQPRKRKHASNSTNVSNKTPRV